MSRTDTNRSSGSRRHGRPDAGCLLLMLYALLLCPVVLSLSGCALLNVPLMMMGMKPTKQTSPYPTIYIAEGDTVLTEDLVRQWYDSAEQRLGYSFLNPTDYSYIWRTAPGTVKAKSGDKGELVNHDGRPMVMTGSTDNYGNTTIYLTNGKLPKDPMHGGVHEAGHHILDSNGVPWSEHHAIMRKAGFN